MSTFAEYATQTLSPPRLRGKWGTRWVAATSAEYDTLIDQLDQQVKARFPSHCPADGLAVIGVDRQIQRAFDESDASYAQRLRAAWETWEWAGTGPGIRAGLNACGIPSEPWPTDTAWTTEWPSDGCVWLLPFRCVRQIPFGLREHDAQFCVVVDYYRMTNGDIAHMRGEPGFLRGKWGARGTKMSSGQMATIKYNIRKWKAAGETCFGIYFCMTDNSVASLRLPLWTRGNGTTRGGRAAYGTVPEEGYRA